MALLRYSEIASSASFAASGLTPTPSPDSTFECSVGAASSVDAGAGGAGGGGGGSCMMRRIWSRFVCTDVVTERKAS